MDLATVEIFPNCLSHITLSTRLVSELGHADSTLRATAQRADAAVIIYAGGEVDASNEDTWRRLVAEAGAAVTPPGPLVVDVQGLDFMACCAFAVLADEAAACRRRGIELRLVSRQRVVSRIIEASGLGALLPVHPSVDSVLSATTAESRYR
jgi:anti-anti-sigma factor